MRRDNEQHWVCGCGNRIVTFVRVSESPVCNRHLHPVRMAEVYNIKWDKKK